MARARNIKPGFFKNEVLAEMPALDRLLFIGLWCLADREGRLEDRPKRIKMELFPAESVDIDLMLDGLSAAGFVIRYEVEGKRYLQVENFAKHQKPHHKEAASEIPAPAGRQQVTKQAYDVPPHVRDMVFKRDGCRCLRCGSVDRLSIDHIKPLAAGGDNDPENLQTLCLSCNSSKGDTTKDYRNSIVDPCMDQARANDGAPCPTDSLIPSSLIPDTREELCAPAAPTPPADDLFDRFWALYPRKQDKAKARKAWAKLKVGEELFALIAKGLAAQAASHDWLKDNGQYVPMPTTWLNGRRWEDEVKPPSNVTPFVRRVSNGPDFYSDDTSWANDLGPF